MASLLRSPSLGSTQVVGFAPDLPPDPEWERRLAQTETEAYARGIEQGRRLAVDELTEKLDGFRTAVLEGVERATAEVRARLQADAERMVSLALDLAEMVTGAVPTSPEVLTERIRQALQCLDGTEFVVELHPEDAPIVSHALDDPRWVVRESETLIPGEARIRGEWGVAELTRDVAWTVLREAFDAN